MVFSSITFLLYFLPLFLLLYHLGNRVYKNYVILLFSLLFYSWGAPRFVFILLIATALDFYFVKALYGSPTARRKKAWLIISLSMNLGLLAYFKYANFFIENVNAVLSSAGFTQINWTRIVLPVGISFYTFQTLTYAVDVYRNVHKPLDKLSDYFLFILSFPQMIAGPIVRFNQMADDITGRQENIDDKLQGFIRFCIGLAKKVLVANVMGQQAKYIMELPIEQVSMATAWMGTLAYTFQIYFDFAGYSDMAVGLGKIMGFKFPENFDNPYCSGSISEFWRRWHMTLGSWMRDYLYIPLGGNRVASKQRMYFNLWLVFLLSGLWHGASWNYVLWGAYHGLFLILDRLFLLKLYEKTGKGFAVPFTFFLVMVGWVMFKIENLDHAFEYLGTMFSFNNTLAFVELPAVFYTMLTIAIVFSFMYLFKPGKWIQQFFYRQTPSSLAYYASVSVVAGILFLLSIGSLTTEGFNPFIYYRF